MAFSLDKLFALLSCVLGGFILNGWIFAQELLKASSPNLITTAFNTALCMTLIGIALLLPESRSVLKRKGQIIIAIFIMLFSSLILLQDLANINLGVDQIFVKVRIEDYKLHPGRMVPQTAFSFILCGILLLLLNTKLRWANEVIQIIILLLITLAIIGLVGAAIRLELFYSWYKYSRMAAHTAIGLLFLAISFWVYWYRATAKQGEYLERLEKRISVTGVFIIIMVALSAGMSGFGILVNQMEKSLEASLTENYKNSVSIAKNEITAGIDVTIPFTTRILLNEYLVKLNNNPNDLNATHVISRETASFLNNNFTLIAIYSNKNKFIAKSGEFIESSELTIPLIFENKKTRAELLWKNGAFLRMHIDIINDGIKIGTAVAEMRLPYLTKIVVEGSSIGETSEIGICHALDQETMECLPVKQHKEVFPKRPRIKNSVSGPMDHALKGLTGTLISRDYLDHQVVAVYGPIGSLGLGMVVKIDSNEFYGPIGDKLEYSLVILTLFIIIGILVQRMQLLPMVNALIISEREATYSKTQIQTIMASVADGIITIKKNGVIQSFNPAVNKIFGYKDNELFGRNINILIPRNLNNDNFTENGTRELIALRKDGSEFFIMLTISEMMLENENYFVGSIRDITDDKKLEKLKKEFISTVSHELRTPLTSIRGSLGLVMGGVVGKIPQEARELIFIAHNNSERLVRLINDILDMEKIESGQMRYDMKEMVLSKSIQDAVVACEGFADEYSVKLVFEDNTEEVNVSIDSDRFQQVMANLISNAIKFSPEHGTVRIVSKKMTHKVRVEVIDSGKGIPKEFQSRIFGKFAQADSSDSRTKGGTGLGLSITQAIIDKFRGNVSFTTHEGKGTTFFFELPIANPVPASNDLTVATAQNKEPILLVCEDDNDIARLLGMMIKQEGMDIDISNTIDDARKKLLNGNYQVLLLDLILPDGYGVEFIKELRHNPRTHDLPIIVVSAKAEEGRKQIQGSAIEIIDWLEKPIDPLKIKSSISKAMQMVDSAKPKILHIEDDVDLSFILSAAIGNDAQIINAKTIRRAKALLKKEKFNMAILDIQLPDGQGGELIAIMAKMEIPILILSASETEKDIEKKVAKALVKSRVSENDIILTIKKILQTKKRP